MAEHPCPKPTLRRKEARDGLMWACTCGRVYVLRHWWNYAGEGYEWAATNLRLGVDQ